MLNSGNVNLSGVAVSGNVAGIDGGGVFNSDGELTMNHCTISGNSAQHGGSVYVGRSTALTDLDNSTVSGNSAYDGGGLYSGVGAPLAISDCTISSNTAQNVGGALDNGWGGPPR